MPIFDSVQTHPQPIPVASEAEMLLFNQLLEGLTLENETRPTDDLPSEESLPSGEAEEDQTAEMDEVLLLEMQKFIRMPLQQPLEPEVAVRPSFEQPVVSVLNQVPVQETVDRVETLESIETPVVESLLEEVVPQQNPERIENEAIKTQENKLLTEDEIPKQIPEKISEHLPEKPLGQLPEQLSEKSLEQLPEQLETLERLPNERVPFLAPALSQPNTAMPVEIVKTTLVWQEPTQVIRELGETITLTLEQSPAPTAKVIQIALTPESFGEMEIQLTFQEERVEAVIIVPKEEIKQQLLEQLDQIRTYLPQNPIVHKITIAVASPIQMPFQPQFEQSPQSRKQSQSGSKNDPRETSDREEQQESAGVSLVKGFSVYV